MVNPQYYRVEYAINPHMKNKDGTLNLVDPNTAMKQWRSLKAKFAALSVEVIELAGQPDFPDLVFCANQTFPFINLKTKRKSIVLSQMRAPQRQGEVGYFQNEAEKLGYDVFRLETKGASFEGNGDLIPQPKTTNLWGGCGPRTDESVYQELRRRFDLNITSLRLVDPQFYHLDTCFSVLSHDTVAIVKMAFEPEALPLIQKQFKNVIEIPYQEALTTFAGNSFCPDGKNIISHPGASEFKRLAEGLRFLIHEIDTSEFMKSGGSVFCMKMALL